MNEELLYSLQQLPDPAFARTLHERLQRTAAARPARHPWPLRRLAMAATVVLVVGGLFTLPGVRASAEAFLSMFRVVNFVAVPVSSKNATALMSDQLDLPRLVGNQVQILQVPGAPVPIVSPEAAASSAGFAVAQPSFIPNEMTLEKTSLVGAGAVKATIDASRLNDILNALSIRDIEVPAALNGQTVYVNTSPIVTIEYRRQGEFPAATLIQGLPPQVQTPPGLDLPRLGEIALRVLGMASDDARRMAQSIDWSSTLLVPIPPNASAFRQIEINGHQAIEVTQPIVRAADGTITSSGKTMLLWSTGDRVFALEGRMLQRDQLQQMALSIR